ncbi:response regulator transcription factor [Pontibacillus yanchengensis]|nr:response regulator [Pontibacillus yanchengensis]
MAQSQHVGSRIVKTFNHFLQYYQESKLACGIIIVRTDLNEKELENLQSFMEKEEPTVGAQFSYDHSEGLLGILLDDCNIGYTHFYSLFIKDYLQQQGCLKGSLLVGSFPESSDYAEQMLFSMIWEMMDKPQDQYNIELFQYDRPSKECNRSILLVDSDESVLEILSSFLRGKGYDVHTAKDGKEGLDQFEKIVPELVITEINLSALGGYQFINQVRDAEAPTQIMVLTNKHLEEDMKRTFEFGVSEYMTKPFSLIEIEARMKRLIEHSM